MSPGVDAGVANGLLLDQRGATRTSDNQVANPPGSDSTDIGAVELPDTGVDARVKAKKTQKQGGKVKIKLKASAAEAADIVAEGTIKAGKKKHRLKPRWRASPLVRSRSWS